MRMAIVDQAMRSQRLVHCEIRVRCAVICAAIGAEVQGAEESGVHIAPKGRLPLPDRHIHGIGAKVRQRFAGLNFDHDLRVDHGEP